MAVTPLALGNSGLAWCCASHILGVGARQAPRAESVRSGPLQSWAQGSSSLRLVASFTPLVCFKSYVGELPRAPGPRVVGSR